MRAWLTIAALSLAAIGIGVTADTVAAQPILSPGHDAIAGAELFSEKGCAGCHAVDSKGGGSGPNLSRTSRPRSFYDLAAALWNHAPQMAAASRRAGAPRPRLTAREAGNIAAYLFTLDYFDPRGDADAGGRLFAAKGCAACHEIGGSGGRVGPKLDSLKPYASPIALAATMWNHGPAMAKAMAAKGIERPSFTGRELIDVIAYINRASPTLPSGPIWVIPGRIVEGGKAFAEQGCVQCHRPSAAGGSKNIDLAERGAHKSLTEFAAAMWNKAPAMTDAMSKRSIPVPRLTPQGMADIVAYLYSVRYFAGAGDPRNGVILAQQKGCFECHGLYGERGKPASDLAAARGIDTAAGVLASLWNHTFVDDPRRARDAQARALTGPEMGDLIAYLRSLARSRK
ncbi:MAG TPA: c-type cytochrome [Methylomirabilota bacterium]|jgi:mono/diheme cytochrome c family protein|nr:c-type cytochrome [Methylomirabilota bacterium]